ncbi:hypothetical protein K3495_g10511 [Podosphaera aphanis]|nr:hypothetical protein K3495_g10511 [Podosphaera aphanis]
MTVTRIRETRELFLDQEQYLEKALLRMDLSLNLSSTGKPRLIPMSGRYKKLEQARPNEIRTNRTEYQQNVGSLMFAAVCSGPDIAFHIGRLSQQLQDPVERHDSGIKELGRYLRTTIGQKIRFGPPHDTKKKYPGPHPDLYLKLYSGADWANMEGRKSVSSYVSLLYGGPVSWVSQKKNSINFKYRIRVYWSGNLLQTRIVACSSSEIWVFLSTLAKSQKFVI